MQRLEVSYAWNVLKPDLVGGAVQPAKLQHFPHFPAGEEQVHGSDRFAKHGSSQGKPYEITRWHVLVLVAALLVTGFGRHAAKARLT